MLGLLFLSFALVSVAAEVEAASIERTVRVLIYDQPESLRVGRVNTSSASGGPPAQIRLDARGGLVVDGRPTAGAWSPDPRANAGARPAPTRIWQVGNRTYRGDLKVLATEGRIQILNRVALDDYLASILGAEMSPSWPAQALRAQAVASRTYALYHAQRRRNEAWDVQATVASQVYRGVSAESPETRAAAEATSGEILTYDDEPILAVFHSTSGGRTAAAGEVWGEDHPYLRSIEVEEEDDAPHTYWRVGFEADDFAAILTASGRSVGAVDEVKVTSQTESGRAETLRIEGSRGTETLHGDSLRSLLGALGLRSKLFEVRQIESGFAFVGSGYGHGVGMSQWGARSMAERGEAYQRILAQFYPGARLERRSEAFLASSGQFGSSDPVRTSGAQAQGDPR